MLEQNPFLSSIYMSHWVKLYLGDAPVCTFDAIEGLSFYKHKILPYYVNVGRNFTGGVNYQLSNSKKFKHKVCLIYDVPDYLNHQATPNIGIKKVQQYKGYFSNLKGYDDFDTYLRSKWSKRSISKINKSKVKFETAHAVSYKTYYATVDKLEYTQLMSAFKDLIIRRFEALRLHNDIIDKWPFYEAIMYPLILEKKALINAVYADDVLVAASIAFINGSHIIGAIKTFDITYSSYGLGNIELINLIAWSFNNGFECFDFSKGSQAYKMRYIDSTYTFESHILYDTTSIISKITANLLSKYFKTKQYLRDQGVNTIFARIKHALKL